MSFRAHSNVIVVAATLLVHLAAIVVLVVLVVLVAPLPAVFAPFP